MFEAYKGLNEFEKAFEYSEKYYAIKDSLFKLEKLIAVQKVEVQFLHKNEIVVERNRKGIIKHIDIRPFIDTITNDKKRLNIRTKTINGRTVRVNEILDSLFKNDKHSSRNLSIHRKNQFVQNENSILTPMEIL